MASVSVRVDRREFFEIDHISKTEKKTKSDVLRDILDKGIREKKLELALERFQHNEASASKAAEMAGIPLTKFLDVLKEKGLSFHYGLEELRDDMADLL